MWITRNKRDISEEDSLVLWIEDEKPKRIKSGPYQYWVGTYGVNLKMYNKRLYEEFKYITWEKEPVKVDLEKVEETELMPIEKKIIGGRNRISLFKCDHTRERAPYLFISVSDFLEHNFYTDDGEFEAYLSDGEYFIGVNLGSNNPELKETDEEFINNHKQMFSEEKKLCIYFIDYPECK